MNVKKTLKPDNEIDLEICTAYLMKEWTKRYKRVFKIDYTFRVGDSEKIKDMIRYTDYNTAFIALFGAIRLYPEKWKSGKYKWLSVNQVYMWIGEEIIKMYQNKEFKIKVTYPKL